MDNAETFFYQGRNIKELTLEELRDAESDLAGLIVQHNDMIDYYTPGDLDAELIEANRKRDEKLFIAIITQIEYAHEHTLV